LDLFGFLSERCGTVRVHCLSDRGAFERSMKRHGFINFLMFMLHVTIWFIFAFLSVRKRGCILMRPHRVRELAISRVRKCFTCGIEYGKVAVFLPL
jgi:hypothetical protein